MMDYLNVHGFGAQYGFGFQLPFWAPSVFVAVILWSLVWKGLALWHSARRGEGWWFIALLLINTIGILEIIYLFGVCKLTFSNLFSSRMEHAA